MRYIASPAYFALMTAWIYYGLDARSDVLTSIWILPFIVIIQLALGFSVDRWWAFLLPAALVPLSMPAGSPEITPDNAEPLPVWFGVLLGAAYAMPIVMLGFLARRGARYLRQAGRGSRSAPETGLPSASSR